MTGKGGARRRPFRLHYVSRIMYPANQQILPHEADTVDTNGQECPQLAANRTPANRVSLESAAVWSSAFTRSRVRSAIDRLKAELQTPDLIAKLQFQGAPAFISVAKLQWQGGGPVNHAGHQRAFCGAIPRLPSAPFDDWRLEFGAFAECYFINSSAICTAFNAAPLSS